MPLERLDAGLDGQGPNRSGDVVADEPHPLHALDTER
jgi:hypothetical protein